MLCSCLTSHNLRCGFTDIAQLRLTQTYIEHFVNNTGRLVQDIKLDLVIARSSKRTKLWGIRAHLSSHSGLGNILCCHFLINLQRNRVFNGFNFRGLPFENARRSSVEYPVSCQDLYSPDSNICIWRYLSDRFRQEMNRAWWISRSFGCDCGRWWNRICHGLWQQPGAAKAAYWKDVNWLMTAIRRNFSAIFS